MRKDPIFCILRTPIIIIHIDSKQAVSDETMGFSLKVCETVHSFFVLPLFPVTAMPFRNTMFLMHFIADEDGLFDKLMKFY